jgi:hypothetical protein
MKVSAETEPVPLEEVMVETGKNEALAAAFPFLSFPFLSFPFLSFGSKTLYLFILARVSFRWSSENL